MKKKDQSDGLKVLSHICWFEYTLKLIITKNIKLHHNFIYLYQTTILIHNTGINIKVLTLLSSYIFKLLQRFKM